MDLYLNHFYLLERFILYFRNKARDIITNYDKSVLAYSRFYKERINSFNINDEYCKIHNEEFLNRTIVNKIYRPGDSQYIPRKAAECLYYHYLGKPMKEIGALLSISPRTVERHLQNIKFNFNLTSPTQLLDLCEYYNLDKLHLKHFSSRSDL